MGLDELGQLHARYRQLTHAHVADDIRPSDAQLSALAARLKVQKDGAVHAPFAEFAVFGPYDGRYAKLRQFQAQVMVRDGTWRNKMLSGPSSFAEWEASWRVYSTALVMLGVAYPGELSLYFDGIRQLAALFPSEWASIAHLDEQMRSEQWPRLYQEIRDEIAQDNSYSPGKGFKMSQPWAWIIPSTRYGFMSGPRDDWWHRNFMILERSSHTKSSGVAGAPPVGQLPGPALPSFQGLHGHLSSQAAGSHAAACQEGGTKRPKRAAARERPACQAR